ncbi:hypothetical protein DFH07DRAFT_903996 [Mycena maculata]|uniref:RRM domain-containing protein n=1 Tax=Mycena maculata TaxID=230809 RepID=A0AAD7J3I3_9AGAR|nr:hypothetical protein DFH07DRAFT_903996 [Mycena maculata]
MNRHHPYGGGSFESPMRRGGPPSGPGPDRPQRFSAHNRGRGFGRGRGGGYGGNASFDGSMSNGAYDQGPPADPSMTPYSNYEAPQQDPYFQNNNYGAGGPQFSVGPPPSVGYDQGFGNYEGSNGNFDDGRGAGRRPPVRKEREDKVHDSIIEERIQRERPCRTLFIRNIKYETNSDAVRQQFEEHGEIKTFFDLISTRGMVFVTYYDLRAAERARDRLQGSEISGRPIDVHYSLPRDDHAKGGDRDKNQQLQGCLQVTLRNSPSGQIDDNEVRHKFQQFGDVKTVKPVGDRSDSRYVEFYDIRACDAAYDRLRHQSLQDGVMDIVFAWDESQSNGPMGQRDGDDGFRGGRGRGNRGNRGRGGRGRGQWDDEHRGGGGGGNWGGQRDRGGHRGGYDNDDYGHRGGRGGYQNQNQNHHLQQNDRFDANRGGYGGPPITPVPDQDQDQDQDRRQTADDRLEQARKVQALLAALKPPEGGAAAPPPGPPVPAAPPPMPMQQGPPAGYYGPPPGPNGMPPPNAYPQPPPGAPYGISPPPPGPGPAGNPALNGLPPHLLALLQSAQQQHQGGAPSPYGMPPAPGGPGMPQPGPMGGPPMMNSPPPGPGQNGNPAQYQQLLYHLLTTRMLVLSRLQDSLRSILSPPGLHTVVLLTPAGQLVSFASYASRSKDEIRVIAGLSGEVWSETAEMGAGMVDSEVRLLSLSP